RNMTADAMRLRALADALDERHGALTGRAPRLRLVAAEEAMGTEAEKAAILTAIRDKAMIADRVGLAATARHWRELFAVVLARPAGEIVLATHLSDEPMRVP